jgi:hypothetical protein
MQGTEQLSCVLRRYLLLVILLSTTLSIVLALAAPGRVSDDDLWRAVVLGLMLMVSERFPIRLAHNTNVSMTTTICVALLFVSPIPLVGLTALVGVGIGRLSRRHDDPSELLFNAGQVALATLAGALIYHATNGLELGPSVASFGPIGAILLAAVAFFLVNTALVATAAALNLHAHPLRVWSTTFAEDLPAEATLATLGVVIAHLSMTLPLALPALLLPVVLVHRSLQQAARLRADTQEALAALVDVVELRDPYTAGHSTRVAEMARALALRLEMTPEEADLIESAGRVHDVGKVAIDPGVLTKAGALTEAEWVEMRRHPGLGADVVQRLSAYGTGHRLVRHHHEAWNGRGYADQLQANAIPLGARILAVADAYDAMTSARPYRQALSPEEARETLRQGAGQQWDARVVAALLDYLTEQQQVAMLTDRSTRPHPTGGTPATSGIPATDPGPGAS